jgi:hypothetical protein
MQEPRRGRDLERNYGILMKMETAYGWTQRRRVNLYTFQFFYPDISTIVLDSSDVPLSVNKR